MSQCGYRKLQMDRVRFRWLVEVTGTCRKWADGLSDTCSTWADDRIHKSRSYWAPYSWFCYAFFSLAKWICIGVFGLARLVCLLYIILIGFLWQFATYIIWLPCKLFSPNQRKRDRIQHVFVVMLENRSFDHMLGFSNIHGIDAISGKQTTIDGLSENTYWNLDDNGNRVFASKPALWAMLYDPGHEFVDVRMQLCGEGNDYSQSQNIRLPRCPNGKDGTGEGEVDPHINNSGFVKNYIKAVDEHQKKNGKIESYDQHDIMKCYSPDQLPILTTLAKEFVVCDRWFSSIPGPTWPNRFFVHAATSGGLITSPTNFDMVSSILFNGYKFENGTIYDQLDDEDLKWTIYKGDEFPQSLAISDMNLRLLEGRFKDLEDFSRDVTDPGYSTSYAFIEPNYGQILPVNNFKCGNSQHPVDDITRGERLIKTIYETIRNSPHWESSVLIIMYDEHGGFYDHVAPPATVAPGDLNIYAPLASQTDPDPPNFDFQQLGVRIPVVIVSPFIPKGTIDHTVYDHSSLLATVEDIFGLQSLTRRDKGACTFKHLFSLDTPRIDDADAPRKLPEPANSGIPCGDDEQAGASRIELDVHAPAANAPLDPTTRGFVHVAFLRDLQISSPVERAQLIAKFRNINTKLEAKQYLEEVRQKVLETKK